MSTAVAVRPPSHDSPLPSRETPTSERHQSQHPTTGLSPPRSYASSTIQSPSVRRHPQQQQMPSSSPSPARPQPQEANTANHTPQTQRQVDLVHAQTVSPQANSSHSSHTNNTLSSTEQQPRPSYGPIIKKERATSPDASSQQSGGLGGANARHRPKKLDLSNDTPVGPGPKSAKQTAPLTAKESAGLSAIQDVGLACLSPGFALDTPETRRLVEKSMDLREQQRRIIEARLNKNGKESESSSKGPLAGGPPSATFSRPLATSRRKGPPVGLSITAPSAQQFVSEPRVIQSAPLHQSFTGLNKGGPNVHPLSRQVLENSHHQHYARSPAAPSGAALPPHHHHHHHHHHVPTPQTALPSISNMFPPPSLDGTAAGSPAQRPVDGHDTPSRRNSGGSIHAPPSSSQHQTLPSPGFPPKHQTSTLHPPQHHAEREFRSADEAVRTLSGGREDLLPKIVHYGGHQPPTPPSPLPPGHPNATHQHPPQHGQAAPQPQYAPYTNSSYSQSVASTTYQPEAPSRSSSNRRRTREEYEQDVDRMDLDPRAADERERRRTAAPASGQTLDWTAERERDLREREGRYAEYGRIGGGAPSSSSHQPVPSTTGGNRSDAKEYHDREQNVSEREREQRKKLEFLDLCSRAWDLLHS